MALLSHRIYQPASCKRIVRSRAVDFFMSCVLGNAFGLTVLLISVRSFLTFQHNQLTPNIGIGPPADLRFGKLLPHRTCYQNVENVKIMKKVINTIMKQKKKIIFLTNKDDGES